MEEIEAAMEAHMEAAMEAVTDDVTVLASEEARRQARRQRRRRGGAGGPHVERPGSGTAVAAPARPEARPSAPAAAAGCDETESSDDELTTQFMSEYEHDALPPELRGDRQELLELFERMPEDDRRYGDFCYRLAFACWSDRDHRAAASYFARG